ncbi:MAG: SPFH domain-containing protein [Candidatus Paceibacterota bacterium]|jgi:regulator of protease activity HflC (stomatin/prohibitin superfamily)
MSTGYKSSWFNLNWITLVVNAIGLTVFNGVSYLITESVGLNSPIMITAPATILWFAIYLKQGLMVVPENEFRVVERFGQYYRCVGGGLRLLCLPGIIDGVAKNGGTGDHKWHRIDLYKDEKDNLIDFVDGSAAVKIQVWYRIMKSADAAARSVYVVKDTENRIEEIVDGEVRPILQKLSLDEAGKTLDEIGKQVIGEVKESLEEMGIELDTKKGVILTDIVLSDDVVKIRQEMLKGEREAQKQLALGGGYVGAILAIVRAAKADGHEISFEEATEIYQTQRGLETIATKPGDLNFVSSGMSGVLVSLGVGSKEATASPKPNPKKEGKETKPEPAEGSEGGKK